jgi:hypothetical protein
LAKEVMIRTRRAGIVVQCNIIVGHFDETLWDFIQTLFFLVWARRGIDVINLSIYGFDKFSADSAAADAKGITNRYRGDWRAPGWQNQYRVRRVKKRIVLALMKILGIREP